MSKISGNVQNQARQILSQTTAENALPQASTALPDATKNAAAHIPGAPDVFEASYGARRKIMSMFGNALPNGLVLGSIPFGTSVGSSKIDVRLGKNGDLVIRGGKTNDDVSLLQKDGVFSVFNGREKIASFPEDRVKSVRVNTGAGNDRVRLYGVDAGKVSIQTGAGQDIVQVENSKNVSVRTGAGADSVSVTQSQRVAVHTGSGKDLVKSEKNKNLSVSLGQGDDSYNDFKSIGVRVHGGAGNDVMEFQKTKGLHVNGGVGLDFTDAIGTENARFLGTQVSKKDQIKTEVPDFAKYVSDNKDLELAWKDMRAKGTKNSENGQYKATYGGGLNEQEFVRAWNNLGGKQINDIGELSKQEWGMLHYQVHGQKEGRKLPSSTHSVFASDTSTNYVSNNRDLELAYRAMARPGGLSDAQMNEYKAAFGKGLNEKHFVDGWNRLSSQKKIKDISELSRSEWGRLHYLMHGNTEGRDLWKSFFQAMGSRVHRLDENQ